MTLDYIEIKKISQIKHLLNDEIYISRIKGKNYGAIMALLVELFELINNNSEGHFRIVNSVCVVFEEFHELSIEHLFNMFQANVTGLKNIELVTYQEPSWKSDIYDQQAWMKITDEFMKIRDKIVSSGQSLDKLANNLTFSGEPPNQSHAHFIFYSIQDCLNKMDCIKNNISGITQDLCIFRNALQSLHIQELYLLVSDVMQSLEQVQQFRSSFELAMDGLHAAYKDNCKELGHYLMAGHYNRSYNTLMSLFYINLCIYNIRKSQAVSNSVLLSIYWESLIFCRNNHYSGFGKQIFLDSRIENQSFSTRNRFYCSYFYMLANIYEKELPRLIFDFIEQNKSDLVKQSESAILPWYVLVLRVKNEIREFVVQDPVRLEEYLTLLGDLLPKPVAEKYYNTLFGSLQDMKNALGTAFLELSFTTDRLDFISENKYAISLANGLLKKAVKKWI